MAINRNRAGTVAYNASPTLPASVKFKLVGEGIAGNLVRITEEQDTEYATKQPLFWEDGNPKMRLILNIAVTGVRCATLEGGKKSPPHFGRAGDIRPVKVGDVVSVWIRKGGVNTWKRAVREFDDNVLVGDRVWVSLDELVPSKNPQWQPWKKLGLKVDYPKVEDCPEALEAIRIHDQLFGADDDGGEEGGDYEEGWPE